MGISRIPWIFPQKHETVPAQILSCISLLFAVVPYPTHYNQIRCCLKLADDPKSINDSQVGDETALSKKWSEDLEVPVPLNTGNVECHDNAIKNSRAEWSIPKENDKSDA
jgi:hypothetical protein